MSNQGDYAAGFTGEPWLKGYCDHSEIPASEPLKHADVNPAERDQTATFRQDTTSKGCFNGRRFG